MNSHGFPAKKCTEHHTASASLSSFPGVISTLVNNAVHPPVCLHDVKENMICQTRPPWSGSDAHLPIVDPFGDGLIRIGVTVAPLGD